MRQWRVGTFSMGILLVSLGFVLLVSQVIGISVIDQAIKWWPAILIILGLEVLIHIYTSNQEEPRVKYDVFSIFLVFMIMLFSIAAHFATGIIQGIIPLRFH
jgi:hypothetical protein